MKRLWLGIIAAVFISSALAIAQVATTPFKLGTFERQGKPFLGIVLRESIVIDFAAANAASGMPASKIAAPTDMKDLISRYDQGLRARIAEIIRSVESAGAAARPPYVSDLSTLKILPPIIPATMMNVAVNYADHDIEMAKIRQGAPGQAAPTAGGALPGTKSAPGIWERTDTDPRWNPYMFLKAPAAIIAHGEAIRLPPGRTQVEWECELGLVISRTASHVPIASATDYIFGYTLQNDVSDRGGRGDTRYGSDWLVLKNHDTFAPLGPFITPKEFIPERPEAPDPLLAEREGAAGGHHGPDDSHRRRAGELRDQHSDPADGRHHRDRHAPRGRLRPYPADLLQAGRSVRVHVRRRWHADQSGRRLAGGSAVVYCDGFGGGGSAIRR